MSHTTIIHIYPNEKVECGEELANSYGSAYYVWDFLLKKYIGEKANIMHDEEMEKLWKLYKRIDIPFYFRSVLMMTFDRAYVSKENYKRAANDIRAFLKYYSNGEVINHWYRIADIFDSDPDVPGIGFWITSVSENPFHGDYDEEKEEYLPPNWNEIYEVYEKLDSLD